MTMTMTSASHMEMCHTVPRPVLFTWQCVKRYHKQRNMTMRHTIPRLVQHDNAPYGKTTSVFHMAICHTVHDQCLSPGNMSYHDQRLSHGTKVESSTPSSDEVYLFSDLGKLCHFLRIQFLKDDIKCFFFLNQKTKMSIYTKRENAIGANRRYFYQVCFCVDWTVKLG